MKVKMHPRPMKRHTSHIQTATCDLRIQLANDDGPNPGLHLRFTLDDGSTQLVVFGPEAAAELERAAKLARVGSDFDGAPPETHVPGREAGQQKG